MPDNKHINCALKHNKTGVQIHIVEPCTDDKLNTIVLLHDQKRNYCNKCLSQKITIVRCNTLKISIECHIAHIHEEVPASKNKRL